MSRNTDHATAVDLEHKLRVAADQAKADAGNGVILLATRIRQQQSGLPTNAAPDPDRERRPKPDNAAPEEPCPATSVVEAAAFARDRKADDAGRFLSAHAAAVKALDELRHAAKRLTAGLDTGTYTRRCTDGYSAACRDRDFIDPRGNVGQCDACRKARDRDNEKASA